MSPETAESGRLLLRSRNGSCGMESGIICRPPNQSYSPSIGLREFMSSTSRLRLGIAGIQGAMVAPRNPSTLEDHLYQVALGVVEEGTVTDERSLSRFAGSVLESELTRADVPESRRKNLITYFKMCVRAALKAGIPRVEQAVSKAGSFRQAYERMYFRDLIDSRPLGTAKPMFR